VCSLCVDGFVAVWYGVCGICCSLPVIIACARGRLWGV